MGEGWDGYCQVFEKDRSIDGNKDSKATFTDALRRESFRNPLYHCAQDYSIVGRVTLPSLVSRRVRPTCTTRVKGTQGGVQRAERCCDRR